MAIAPENRGGANGGPQYSPANVSGVGGAGQSGEYTGFAYGMNKAIKEQKAAASIKPRPVNMPPAEGMQVTPITEKTQRSYENIMTGLTPYGQPNDPNALGIPAEPDNAQFNTTIDSYMPVISWIQSRPQTSKETRSVLAMLMRGRGE